jgi:NTE family protein
MPAETGRLVIQRMHDKTMTNQKTISLGLQGGGTYGAFAWGVLDRLLDDGRFGIEAISAASAGAINAVALADGHAHGGGNAGARRSLEQFWRALGQSAIFGPMRPSPADRMAGRGGIETSPGYMLLQLATATLSPALLNPLNIHPLSGLLSSLIDFARVRASELKLFISATNVRTGQGHIFRRDELSVAHVMASACLPQVFAPVEIGGEAYWDGSFVGNPPLAPLVDEAAARDILIVQNNPIARCDLPISMADVNNRVNEIAFNISLVREIGALSHVAAVVDEETGAGLHRGPTRLHLVSGADVLRDLSISSKFNTEWAFIEGLHDLGVAAAERWLERDADRVGMASTLDPAFIHAPQVAGKGAGQGA